MERITAPVAARMAASVEAEAWRRPVNHSPPTSKRVSASRALLEMRAPACSPEADGVACFTWPPTRTEPVPTMNAGCSATSGSVQASQPPPSAADGSIISTKVTASWPLIRWTSDQREAPPDATVAAVVSAHHGALRGSSAQCAGGQFCASRSS